MFSVALVSISFCTPYVVRFVDSLAQIRSKVKDFVRFLSDGSGGVDAPPSVAGRDPQRLAILCHSPAGDCNLRLLGELPGQLRVGKMRIMLKHIA